MTELLGRRELERVDPSGMTALLSSWPEQIRAQREELRRTGWPGWERVPSFEGVYLGGLGGSAIAGDIAYGVAEDDFTVPFRVVRDYRWPASVGPDSLCVLSSYSGNTEETLSLYDDAKARGARRLVIASGGAIGERAGGDEVPHLRIPPGLPPRAALGYSLISVLGLFRALGWSGGGERDLDETERVLEEGNRLLGVESPESENPAKQLALALRDHAVILYTPARHLSGVGIRWKGQFNENSKRIAFHANLPELNHNEIVGWETMREIHPRFRAVFLRDREDHPRVSRRIALTREILSREKVESVEIESQGEYSRITRLVSLIQFGDWTSLYLAVLAGVDPMKIEKIDGLKRALENGS